jgi:catechol 2,3-dioxygenase-like lactoylglutathione lyase family enzyme
MKHYDIEKAKDFFAAKAAFTTGLPEVQGMVESGDDVVIVDVRLPSDYRKAHVPGAVNLERAGDAGSASALTPLGRRKAEGIAYGSGPPNPVDDMKINRRGGGRGVYFRDPDGHILELLTVE